MRFVIQRVQKAAVTVDGREIGAIDKGFLVLVGVEDSDTEAVADKMVRKMIGLRIFEDEQGLTNKNLASVGGRRLVVSQFTLYADCRKANRPSFIRAGKPEHAEKLYEYILSKCAESVPIVRHGEFGADMKVSLVNDGPFTIVLDSDEIMPRGN